MRGLEEEMMKTMGFILYFVTVIYYSIVFVCPFVFVSHECGVGLSHWALYTYFIYAFFSSVLEVFTVLRIQSKVRDAGILSFNRWHATELVMGQVARFDTYLDMCFLSIVYQCEMWNLVVPITVFIILMQLYPVTAMISLLKVDTDLHHTQPYMERNCQLSFIRENMLLATVLDRFCINNTTELCGKQIAYGKFMGAYTFFFQDLPQFSIHLYFLFFMHDPASNILHGNIVVKLSLCISFFAFCISSFNFVMFK